MNPDCNPVEQQARQDALEAAYLSDGRDNPAHPFHSTYTALMTADTAKPTLEDQLAAWWRESYPNATLNAQTGQIMVAWGSWLLSQQEKGQ